MHKRRKTTHSIAKLIELERYANLDWPRCRYRPGGAP